MARPLRPTLLLATFAASEDWPSPAADVAKDLARGWDPDGYDLVVKPLEVPRTYAATTIMLEQVRTQRPDVFLLLDTDLASTDYKLHVFAANYDDDPTPDSDGLVRRDAIIDADAPVAFRSRLPLDGIWDKFLVERVPVRMSHKAGGHVFNHILYCALRTIQSEGLPTLAGGIETPPLPGLARDGAEPRPRAEMREELFMIVAVLRHLLPVASPSE